MSDLDLVGLRKIAEAASPGPWRQWNPATGPSHITIGGKVAFESLQSATRFADDEVIPHWCDATHIAAFDPPTVLAMLDRIEELETHIKQLEAEVSDVEYEVRPRFGHGNKLWRRRMASPWVEMKDDD